MDMWQSATNEVLASEPEKQWIEINEFRNDLKEYTIEAADGLFQVESAAAKHYAEGLRSLQYSAARVQTYLDTLGVDAAPISELVDAITAEFQPGERYGTPLEPEQLKKLLRQVWALTDRACNLLHKAESETPKATPPDRDKPQEKQADHKPGFLGLIVDEANRRIRREGFPGEIEFKDAEAQWHTFFVGHKAEERGATNADWLNGYPGYADADSRKQVKHKLKNKLQDIGLSVEKGSGVKIIEWDGE